MKKKVTIAGVLFLAALFVLPMAAFGRGDKDNHHYSGKIATQTQVQSSTLTAEQISQIEDLQKKFREDNADILKQLMVQKFDLKTILGSDSPDSAKAKAIQKEISDLNAKLAQKKIDLYTEILKINPDAKFHGVK
jgi:Spy/CpxP family protein refolding chaperone